MRPDERPQHEKIAATFRAQIMAGLLLPGSRMPSVPTLMEQLGVSNTAIVNAWDMLKGEGYLVSQPGKGVFVRERTPIAAPVTGYKDPQTWGLRYELLNVAEVEAPRDVAEALGEDRAILRFRQMFRGDEPCELSWSYYPLSLAHGTDLAGQGKIRGGAPRVLAEIGHPEHELADRVSARPPTPEEAELLELRAGIPVLRQFRVITSPAGRVVEVSVIVMGSHLYELNYRQAVE